MTIIIITIVSMFVDAIGWGHLACKGFSRRYWLDLECFWKDGELETSTLPVKQFKTVSGKTVA